MPTQRIIDNPAISETQGTDVLVLVDVSDITNSSDGTDKKITVGDLFNNTVVTHAENTTLKKKLGEWVGEFKDAITQLINKTKPASTDNVGIIRTATDSETQEQTDETVALTPSNLSALTATEDMQGLAMQATINDMKEGRVADKMASPMAIFMSMLGTGALGNTTNTFTFPVRNIQGDILMELKVMFAEVTVDTVRTTANPSNNYNHIHPYFDVNVVYPTPLDNEVLMVLPMSLDVEGDATSMGSDFWPRRHTHDLNQATIRCTRINGTGPVDPLEKIRVRTMVIGY